MKKIAVVLIALFLSGATVAQKGNRMMTVKPAERTVCYASGKDEFTTIGPPKEYLNALRLGAAARTKTASIEVTYVGFSAEARAAFQAAVDIWEVLLESPVTIHVHAVWTPLNVGVLGAAGPDSYVFNIDGFQKGNVWYPIALAEKITGTDINSPGEPDIVATFNSANTDWSFGVSTPPPAGKYDLMSIVLHEIGHGLGITHAYSVTGGQGFLPDFFEGRPVLFETGIRTGSQANLVNDFTQPSVALKTALTSNNLFYSSPLVSEVNGGVDAAVYAPATYSAGSSIAHLDEATYPAGNINSLMTPQIGSAERSLDPGPVVKAILADMGWTGTTMKHTALKNTENTAGPYHAVVKVVTTDGYDPNSVTLNYKTVGQTVNKLTMAATGNPDEFAVDLPVGNSKYSYFISIEDTGDRMFTYPWTLIKPGSPAQQEMIVFTAGPDTQPPFINHTPREFITALDGLKLEAVVSDNIGVHNVKVEWAVNGIPQADEMMTLKAGTDSTFELNKTIGGLGTDDKVEYRIRAEDNSVAHNVGYTPSPDTYFELNVVGLGETRDGYANNFDNLSTADFFGNGFTVSKPTGFNNGAIHSDHPYAAAGTDNSLQFIYNLKVPVRIRESEATLRFDEIVLVEPGESGVEWPDQDFYDYVVVEGSTDGGINWVELGDGYDSRAVTVWNNLWESTLGNDNNAAAVGTPTLYRTRTYNLLDRFEAGDEVAFRFRLYSDPFSYGWGWSIDNLNIQVDDVPPTILHQHKDFVLSGTPILTLNAKVTDNIGLDQVSVEYKVNNGSLTTTVIDIDLTTGTYMHSIDLAALGLKTGDELQYRIRATDIEGNAGSYPKSGFIGVAVISMATSLDEFVTDFQSAADVTGNFFSITQPGGFTNPGMGSNHPYEAGMDIDFVSDLTWMVRKPIKVSASNPMIYFDEVAVVEYNLSSVKDFVVVEGSTDGATWEQLEAPYAAHVFQQWRTLFDNEADGILGARRSHIIDITSTGKFKAGDVILIRFRLQSDQAGTGWGWFVDNLSIQGPITGLEKTRPEPAVVASPNPVGNEPLHVTVTFQTQTEVSVEILSMQGQTLLIDHFSAPEGPTRREYETTSWAQGFYVVRVRSDLGTSIRKIIKLR